MKNLLIIILLISFSLHTYSQSFPVAVDDSVTVSLGEVITINAIDNDYHPDGLEFKIVYAPYSYSFTDSTLTYYIDYDTYFNFNENFTRMYRLEDENGMTWSEDSFGEVILDVTNNYSDTLDINNIRALIIPYGTHFWNGPNNSSDSYFYEFPKGSGKKTIYNSNLWIGGLDHNGNLKVSAEMFKMDGIDFWTGPISVDDYNLSIDTSTVISWHQVWKLNKSEVEYHKLHWHNAGYQPIENISNWPAHGDTILHQNYYLAPFINIDGDAVYNPLTGDYPLIKGDQSIFFIFNDLREEYTNTEGNPIGLEIHGMMYQFLEPDNPAFNNTVFLNYKIFNRSNNTLTDTYIGIWTDHVIGYGFDDYVGCDVERGIHFAYNGDMIDGYGEPFAYGENPPAQGIVFLGGPLLDPNEIDDPDGGCDESINGIGFGDDIIDNERFGMTQFLYHTNAVYPNGDPRIGQDYYNFLKGNWKDSTKMLYGGDACDYEVVGPECNFMYPGDSDPCNWGTDQQLPNGGYNQNGLFWSEETVNNGSPSPPGDRRAVGSMGPFTFLPNSVQIIDIAYVTAQGDNGPMSSVDLLKIYVDTIRARYIKNSDDFGSQYLDIKELVNENHQLKIYPNPTGDVMQVEYKGELPNAIYTIHDIYGILHLSESVPNNVFTVNLGNLKSGIYIISVINDKYKQTERLIKK